MLLFLVLLINEFNAIYREKTRHLSVFIFVVLFILILISKL